MQGQPTADHETPIQSGDDDPEAAAYWDIRDIQFHCRIGRSTAWRLVREECFPAPILCGKRTVLWPRGEVMAFLEGRRDPGHYRCSPVISTPLAVSYSARAIRSRGRAQPTSGTGSTSD